MAWSRKFTVDVNENRFTICENGEETAGWFMSNRTMREKIMIAVAKYLGYRPSEVLGFFDNFINKNDYIAMNLWTREDIESMLRGMAYPATEENIDAVVNSGDLNALNDCTDNDWEIITLAIELNAKKSTTV